MAVELDAAGASSARLPGQGSGEVAVSGHANTSVSRLLAEAEGPASAGTLRDRTVELTLCECEKASGSPDGLSCEKEGWFISSFEREGSWLSGGGLVPLSHAVCCRPCLPADLPVPSGSTANPDDKAVAVVSIGCHSSSGPGSLALQCEPNGGSFVSGWGKAVRVSSSIDAYYPIGAVECCTPSVLLTSGDVWELERCNCQFSADINCGGTTSHRLLQGFDQWRITRSAEFVPIAPAQCCKACLSDRIHPMSLCADLNFCSGHGVCNLGACECLDGFQGADCSHQGRGGGGNLPQWLISLIVLGSCITMSTMLIVAGRLIRHFQSADADEDDSEDGEQMREPLILRISEDDQGSVGSEDTTDCESDDEDNAGTCSHAGSPRASSLGPGEPTGEGVSRLSTLRAGLSGVEISIPAAGAAAGMAAALNTEMPSESFIFPDNGIPLELRRRAAPAMATNTQGTAEADEEAEQHLAPVAALETTPGRHRSRAARRQLQAELAAARVAVDEIVAASHEAQPHQSPQPGESEAQVPKDGTELGSPLDEVMKEGEQVASDDNAPRLKLGAECSVCMNRPVQVVIIPCGHACMCRRCSRRVARCPVCRVDILRRQRLFIGG
ncbi:hypothetical protein WJX72_009086 [[Myrmecia] bisecta]|uniref:RING-type domain-containing protein n=1 Tax=[Myrmecia] bisecta TaxID=41462 RepID=A0AAW1QSZ8_9CHLO